LPGKLGITEKIRLAIVASHPIQYQAPLFRRLHARSVIDCEVLFLSTHGLAPSYDPGFQRKVAFDIPLIEGYPHRFLPNVSRGFDIGHGLSLVNPAIVSTLRRESFHAVLVHGYARVSMWLAVITASISHLPYVLRGESRADTDNALPAWKATVKRGVIGRLVRGAGACAVIGQHNRQFYLKYGADPARLVLAPYSVDVDRFAAAADRARQSRQQQLKSLGLDGDRPLILFAAKLQPWKRPLDLVAALQQMKVPAQLVFIGDGPLRGDVERGLASVPGTRVLGFVNQQELGAWYGLADVFVLPSEREPWGLAVNEALAAGTPAVVSDHVGCAPDLITPATGAVVPVGDSTALARTLDSLCADRPRLRAMRTQARAASFTYSLDATAIGIEQAARTAVLGPDM